jgi:hypothetical protein
MVSAQVFDPIQPLAAVVEPEPPEAIAGVFRRSRWSWGFWWRTLTSLGLYYLLLWDRNRITITTQRVHQRHGDLLGGQEISMSLENVTDVFLDEPPMGAIFDYGSIRVQSAGSGGAEIGFEALGRARQMRDLIFDLKNRRATPGA